MYNITTLEQDVHHRAALICALYKQGRKAVQTGLTTLIIGGLIGIFFLLALKGEAATFNNTLNNYWTNGANGLSLQLSSNTNQLFDEVLIQNIPAASWVMEDNLDVRKMFGPFAENPSISSLSEEGYPLSINAVDFMEDGLRIPVEFHHLESGTYILSGWESFDFSIPVWLKDVQTGELHDLSAISALQFTVDGPTDGLRFILRIGEQQYIDAMLEVSQMYSWNTQLDEGFLKIQILEGADELTTVELNSMDGKFIESIVLPEDCQNLIVRLPGSVNPSDGMIAYWYTKQGITLKSNIILPGR